ncbi:uncharacterized protein LOC132726622 isoform X2 [Ruditapes philippinarum]|nr:uncharacterized protein LOC132726622 isoform X2 [Ruditapes philippinarum]
MGQDHSSSQYIDVFDSPKNRRTSNQQLPHRVSEPVLRRGHRDEESETYCYAYSQNVIREEVTLRNANHPTQRSVSLRDDYSQPPDRVLSTASTQDYTEPYQSEEKGQNPASPVVQPDPGGIYELAKDITGLKESGKSDRKGVTSDHYNHLDDVKNRLTSANISDQKSLEERYDHINSWSKRTGPLTSTDSGTEHYISAESSPLRKCSNVSDDVFTSNVAMNKMLPNEYRHLPANYEEPWDSEEGQKRFDRLINKAEKKHETRKSIDQTNSGVPRKSVDQSGIKINTAQTSVNKTGGHYEAAWVGGAGSKLTPVTPPSVPQQHKPSAPANYEDAWDLPEKQKEFEEKLLQARKQRASQGQIREDDQATGDNVSKPFAGPSPPLRKTQPDHVIRSDSCRSLGALAEKIDTSLPLEEQEFFHGPIKRSAAERTLLVFKEGSYLVRRSETSKKDFSLTLKGWNGQPMHMKIACRPDGTYVLGENSPPFTTIPDMVDYYTTHELPVQNADRICLLYPIPC